MTETKHITDFLSRLGIASDEQAIYLSLVRYGAMSITELARVSGVERTALYRLIEPMQAQGMVKIQEEEKRKIIYPAKPQAIMRILDQEELRVHSLRQQQRSFTSQIEEMMGSRTETDVTYYRGVEGIKQIQWNILSSQSKQLVGMRDSVLETVVEAGFTDVWAVRMKRAKIQANIVYSDAFINSMRSYRELLSTQPQLGMKFHYLKPDEFDISHCFDTYDDYVVYYNWGEEDPYAVEIHNKYIAYTTRQMLDMLLTRSSTVQSWIQLLKKNA